MSGASPTTGGAVGAGTSNGGGQSGSAQAGDAGLGGSDASAGMNAGAESGGNSNGGASAGGAFGGTANAGTAGEGPVGGSGGGAGSAGASGSAGAGGAVSMYEPVEGESYDELPIFEGNPPNFKANAPAETVNGQGSISNVSVPTLRRFPMDVSMATGFGYVVFPGGAYTGLDMDTHATRLAERVGPQGIAVFALKYRVGGGSNDAPRDALLDAKRAMRLVKYNAARFGVVSARLGVIGYSAGSHLALNLVANADAGDVNASDPIERESSAPAFAGSMSTWAFYEPESPFTFPSGVPPVYFCHAEDDTLAPIALPREVDEQLRAKGGATQLDFYRTGGHSTCHPGDARVEGRNWPDKIVPWLEMVLN
jgi:acetyl esterase/lipase